MFSVFQKTFFVCPQKNNPFPIILPHFLFDELFLDENSQCSSESHEHVVPVIGLVEDISGVQLGESPAPVRDSTAIDAIIPPPSPLPFNPDHIIDGGFIYSDEEEAERNGALAYGDLVDLSGEMDHGVMADNEDESDHDVFKDDPLVEAEGVVAYDNPLSGEILVKNPNSGGPDAPPAGEILVKNPNSTGRDGLICPTCHHGPVGGYDQFYDARVVDDGGQAVVHLFVDRSRGAQPT